MERLWLIAQNATASSVFPRENLRLFVCNRVSVARKWTHCQCRTLASAGSNHFRIPILELVTTTLIQSDHVNSVWLVTALKSRSGFQVESRQCSGSRHFLVASIELTLLNFPNELNTYLINVKGANYPMEVLSQPKRLPRKQLFEAVLIVVSSSVLFSGAAFLRFNLPVASAVLALWLTFCLFVAVVGRSHEVLYDQGRRKIIVRWRSPSLRLKCEEFSLERFGSVASYYPYGKRAVSTVCLIERSENRGLDINSFDVKFIYRSFWDIHPAMEESDEALDLRVKLSSLLGVPNAGNLGARLYMRRSKLSVGST